MENTQSKDGGARSRKLWFSVGTSIGIIVSSLFVSAIVFGEVVAGLITVCAIYVGGNAATKWITKPKAEDTAAPSPKLPPKLPTKPMERG